MKNWRVVGLTALSLVLGGGALASSSGLVPEFASEKKKTEVKIRYVDIRTNKAIQPQTEKLVPIGAHERFKPVVATGYQMPKAIEKTVGQKTVITFKYLPETYTIKVRYLDDITGNEVKVREYRSTYGAKLILPTYQQQGYHQNPGDTITVKGSETITYRLHRAEASTAMSRQSSAASQVSESVSQSVASSVTSATPSSVSASSASQTTAPVTVTNGPNQLLADATLAKLQPYALAALNDYRARYGVAPAQTSEMALNLAKQESRWALREPEAFEANPHANFNNLFGTMPVEDLGNGQVRYYNHGSEETNGDGSTIQHIAAVNYGGTADQKDTLSFGSVAGTTSDVWQVTDLTSEAQLQALAQDAILQFGDDGQAAGYDGTSSYQQGASHKMGLLTPGNVDVGVAIYANSDGTLRTYVEVLTAEIVNR